MKSFPAPRLLWRRFANALWERGWGCSLLPEGWARTTVLNVDLVYQRKMADSKGKSNAQSLFGVHQIPRDNHIRDLLDGVAPEQVFPMFEEILHGFTTRFFC